MDVVREMALILSDRPNSPTGKAIRLRVGLPGCHVVQAAEAMRADGQTGRRDGAAAGEMCGARKEALTL